MTPQRLPNHTTRYPKPRTPPASSVSQLNTQKTPNFFTPKSHDPESQPLALLSGSAAPKSPASIRVNQKNSAGTGCQSWTRGCALLLLLLLLHFGDHFENLLGSNLGLERTLCVSVRVEAQLSLPECRLNLFYNHSRPLGLSQEAKFISQEYIAMGHYSRRS